MKRLTNADKMKIYEYDNLSEELKQELFLYH